ncbi:MAG: NADPH-dependent F420 reductase [Dehalococcoidia bacterium]
MSIIAFVGGTGPEGRGLAFRLALAGHRVIIGSRRQERAEAAAAEIRSRAPQAQVGAGLNADAVRGADMVFITVPFEAQRDTLASLADEIGERLVVSTAVPLVFEKGRAGTLAVPEGSAAEQAQSLLPRARVVGAFQNLSAHKLLEGDASLEMDVVVCADDAEAKRTVMALAEEVRGLRAVDGGPLANSRYVEDVTALLLNINRRYKAHAGIRIVGI